MLGALASTGPLARLGWIAVDGLWQGLALAAMLALALRLARRKSSAFRHGVALTTLAIWLVVPVAGLALHESARSAAQPRAGEGREAAIQGDGEFAAPTVADRMGGSSAGYMDRAGSSLVERLVRLAAPFAPRLDDLLPFIGLGWLIASCALLLRLLASLVVAARIGRSGRELLDLEDRVAVLARRMGLPGPVAVRESERVDVPTVTGGRRPVLLLPRGTNPGLPDDQLELVLAHELAHLKRRDGLVNLVVAVAEAMLPFHPLTWWAGAVIRLEREQACDDLALATTGLQPVALARALARLEGARTAPVTVLAAGGNAGQLVRRVRRLLGRPAAGSSPRAALPFLGIGLLAAWLGVGGAREAVRPPNGVPAGAPVVAIDAGHGGGTGARGYVDEDPVVLQVAVKLAELLEAEGVATVLTRDSDERLGESLGYDLVRRVEVAAEADSLVSLHANAGSGFLRGIQTWMPDMGPDATLTSRLLASRSLAKVIHPRLVAATGAPDRGMRSSLFYLLYRTSVPAVMVELGFVTHVEEGPLLASDEYQTLLAKALADGILEYLAHESDEVDGHGPPQASGAEPFPFVLTYEDLGF